jgi:hypothetical protein
MQEQLLAFGLNSKPSSVGMNVTNERLRLRANDQQLHYRFFDVHC